MSRLQKFRSKILRPTQYAGVEVLIAKAGRSYRVILLREQNGALEIEESSGLLSTFEEVAQLIPIDCPINLVINGKGILQKQLKEFANNDQAIIQNIFPNTRSDVFYLQKTKMADGLAIAIARKDLVDEIAHLFQAKKMLLTGIALGVLDLRFLLTVVKDKTVLFTPQQELWFSSEKQLIQIKTQERPKEQSLLLADHSELVASAAMSYTCALKGFLQIPSSIPSEQINFGKEEFFHQNVLQKAGMALSFFFLGLLLINTGFYYFYKTKNEQLASSILHSRNQLSELDAIKANLQKQQGLISKTNINQSTRSSYYADQIGTSLPKDLQLQELEIFPMLGKARDYEAGTLVRYDHQKINIKGWCKNSLTYNTWIKELEALPWVAKAQHINYQDVHKTLGEFELQIIIAPSK